MLNEANGARLEPRRMTGRGIYQLLLGVLGTRNVHK